MRLLQTMTLYITSVAEAGKFRRLRRDSRIWRRRRLVRVECFRWNLNEGDDVRERVAYLFMIAMLIVLIAVVFAVLGKGEYQPPAPKEQGAILDVLSVFLI